MPPRLLIAEDDTELSATLREAFAGRYQVVSASTGTSAIAQIEKNEPDVVLLDLGLPEIHGFSVLELLHSRYPRCRVCIMTILDDLESKAAAFAGGSDDYLVKPFSVREMEMRIEALLRRDKKKYGLSLVFGDLCIFRGAPLVQIAGTKVQLTPTEHRLLLYLAERPGEVVSRGILLDEVWHGEERFPNTVDAHIESLRKKLAVSTHKWVKTAYRQGYYFDTL